MITHCHLRPPCSIRLQEALNRASRRGTMGEFAVAVAHEINQPLTAIANYTRLAKRAAESKPPDAAATRRIAGGLAGEAAGLIREVKPAARIVEDMVGEAQRILGGATQFVD